MSPTISTGWFFFSSRPRLRLPKFAFDALSTRPIARQAELAPHLIARNDGADGGRDYRSEFLLHLFAHFFRQRLYQLLAVIFAFWKTSAFCKNTSECSPLDRMKCPRSDAFFQPFRSSLEGLVLRS